MKSAAAAVLGMLARARGATCSGETLSESLGVSRAQIWKHVEALRGLGYEISGEAGGGYRLVGRPDRLYPAEIEAHLETRWVGREIHYFESIDSTNTHSFDLARAGAPHGAAVVAEGQTAGRGRLGRSFFSPAFRNLYVSLIVRPEIDVAAAPTLVPCVAVAVAETIEAELGTPGRVTIKWPNDVHIEGLKSCGILMELGSEAARVRFCILGIGVNLNVAREELPDEFRALATSVSTAAGRRIDRAAFTGRLFGTLEDVLDLHARGGFAAVRPRYESRFAMRGERVRVIEADGREIPGRVAGIDADGALRLARDDGSEERILAGDVTLAKPEPTS